MFFTETSLFLCSLPGMFPGMGLRHEVCPARSITGSIYADWASSRFAFGDFVNVLVNSGAYAAQLRGCLLFGKIPGLAGLRVFRWQVKDGSGRRSTCIIIKLHDFHRIDLYAGTEKIVSKEGDSHAPGLQAPEIVCCLPLLVREPDPAVQEVGYCGNGIGRKVPDAGGIRLTKNLS